MRTKPRAPLQVRPPSDIDVPALAVEVLRHLLALATRPAAYSSRRGHGPPGYAHEAWRVIAAQIGTRRGRWWIVTPEELARYEARPAAPVVAIASPPWSPAAALESVGLHATRRAS